MRTALLLSGQVRDAKDCFSSLEEFIIKPYNTDVFIDAWIPGNRVLDHRNQIINDSLNAQEILDLYKPKSAMFEDFETPPIFQHFKNFEQFYNNRTAYDGSIAYETKMENILYMHYKIWRCFHHINHYEIMNSFTYDTIIRMRFDLKFESFPIIEPQPDTVYVPEGHDHRSGINDLMSLGTRETMRKLCDLYAHLEQYTKSNFGFHPESILRIHMEKFELTINRFPVKYKLRDQYV